MRKPQLLGWMSIDILFEESWYPLITTDSEAELDTVFGHSDIKVVIHRPIHSGYGHLAPRNYGWSVTDLRSGTQIAMGLTKDEARAAADSKLATHGMAKYEAAVKKRLAQFGCPPPADVAP